MKRMHWHLKIPPLTPHNINKPYVFRSTYDSYHRQLHSYCNDWPHILSKRLVLNFPIRFKWIPSTETQLIFDVSEFNDSTTTTTTAIMHDYWFMDNKSKLCRVNMHNKDFFWKTEFQCQIFFVFIRLICIQESWIQDCSSGFFPHFFQNFIKITEKILLRNILCSKLMNILILGYYLSGKEIETMERLKSPEIRSYPWSNVFISFY